MRYQKKIYLTYWAPCKLCNSLQVSSFHELLFMWEWWYDFWWYKCLDAISGFWVVWLFVVILTHSPPSNINKIHWFSKMDFGGLHLWSVMDFISVISKHYFHVNPGLLSESYKVHEMHKLCLSVKVFCNRAQDRCITSWQPDAHVVTKPEAKQKIGFFS